MHIFGCEDTTTRVMDYLTREETRPLMCVNNDFNNIRNNGYHSIRVIQDFIRKNKKIKCHENKYNCRKISFQELYNNTNKYIGRTIQFIIRYHKCSPTKEIDPILWHSKLGGIHNPYDNVFRPREKGILAINVGYTQDNIYSNHKYRTFHSNNPNSFIFFNQKNDIYPHSLRIID